MAPNRKRLEVQAPEDRWKLLGRLLEDRRRVELGYQFRTPFARERLPLTPYGNPNKRLIDDIESNRRPNRWPSPTLKELAAAYRVTYESVRAVLAGERDDLVPDAAGRLAVADPLVLPPAPFDDPVREAADRPYAEAIWKQYLNLPRRVTEPAGEQMFPGAPDDAKAWDGIGPRLPLGDLVWVIADVRRREAGRVPPNSGTGAAAS